MILNCSYPDDADDPGTVLAELVKPIDLPKPKHLDQLLYTFSERCSQDIMIDAELAAQIVAIWKLAETISDRDAQRATM